MTEEIKNALADYFDVGEFAELIGVDVLDLIDAFEDKVDDCLVDLLEIMEYEDDETLGEE